MDVALVDELDDGEEDLGGQVGDGDARTLRRRLVFDRGPLLETSHSSTEGRL